MYMTLIGIWVLVGLAVSLVTGRFIYHGSVDQDEADKSKDATKYKFDQDF
jgi:hypothetical protein